jgi:hypothetical protein
MSMGDNTGNAIGWCRIAMDIDLFWQGGAKGETDRLIRFGCTGYKTENNFERLYFGYLWTEFDGMWCPVICDDI